MGPLIIAMLCGDSAFASIEYLSEDMVRKALDGNWHGGLVHEVGRTVGKSLIRLLDEAEKSPTGQTQPPRRTTQDGPRLRTIAQSDGGYFKFRPRVNALGKHRHAGE